MKLELRQMIMSGIFAALMIVSARFLSIPTPFGVPITFQLFFAVYAGLLLGSKAAFLSQVVYIILGLVGLPVFTKGGGVQYIFSPTFGYIIGFALAALIIGLMVDRMREITFAKVLMAAVVGYLVIYIGGNLYFYGMMNGYLKTDMSMTRVFVAMGPYMVKDFVLLILAASTATVIIPTLRMAGYMRKA